MYTAVESLMIRSKRSLQQPAPERRNRARIVKQITTPWEPELKAAISSAKGCKVCNEISIVDNWHSPSTRVTAVALDW